MLLLSQLYKLHPEKVYWYGLIVDYFNIIFFIRTILSGSFVGLTKKYLMFRFGAICTAEVVFPVISLSSVNVDSTLNLFLLALLVKMLGVF